MKNTEKCCENFPNTEGENYNWNRVMIRKVQVSMLLQKREVSKELYEICYTPKNLAPPSFLFFQEGLEDPKIRQRFMVLTFRKFKCYSLSIINFNELGKLCCTLTLLDK